MRLRHLVAFLALLVALLAAPAARAQGTSGQMPDPISTNELRELLELYVKPTAAQWETIESLHDDYRAAFKTLREGEIEAFLKEMRTFQGEFPSKDRLESFMKKFDALNKRIEAVDGTLFDGVATIVGDDRRPDVDRARDARARKRYRQGMTAGMPFGGGDVDVAAIALRLDLPKAEAEAIDPTLRSYEQRLTVLTRDIHQQTIKGFLSAFEELDKLGLSGLSQQDLMADPQRMQQVMEAMQAAMKKVFEKTGKIQEEIVELSSKTFRSVSASVTGEAQRRLRINYIRAAHAELAYGDNNIERVYRAALKMRSLNEEQKAAVKASYESWMRADDAILDDGIKALDSFKAGMSPFDFNPEDFQKRQERITEVSSKRIELAQKSLEELKGITGDERIEKLNVFAAQHAADDPFAMQGDPEADPASPELAIRAGPAEEPGEIALEYNEVPQAIGVGTVQSLAGRMHLDDGKKAILETLHSDYVKKWDEELKPVADAARTAQQSMWNFEGGEGKPDRSKANLYFDKRREMLQMATAHDAAFFDDAQKAIGDDHARDLRLARLERTLQVIGGRPGSYTMFALGDRERTVNLPQVLREMQADDAERAKLEELLDARAEAMQKALAESAVEQLQLEQKMTDFQFVVQESYRGNDGGDSDASSRAMAAARDVGIKMMEVQQAMDRLAEKQAAALRTALDELLAALPESRREALQWAYDQAAYPQIFRDPRSAMPFIEKAQTFGDLTEAQRTQLQALHDSYRTDYMQHCRDMVPKQEPAAPGAKPEEQMMRQMERMNATAKVQFERDERSARAVSQLKRILTEEQSKRIAGLGDYEKNAPQGQGQFFAPD